MVSKTIDIISLNIDWNGYAIILYKHKHNTRNTPIKQLAPVVIAQILRYISYPRVWIYHSDYKQ